jgi:uncharacterized protein (TIGR00725 family)
MARKQVIAIIGTGREVEPAMTNAREVGCLIAASGRIVITGGRNAGVMKAANEGANEVSGLTIGILPKRETEVSPAVDVAIFTDTGEARNNIIVLSADAVVACGVDDPGTASEVALALKAGKPVVLLAADTAATAFFVGISGENVHVAESPGDALELLENIL